METAIIHPRMKNSYGARRQEKRDNTFPEREVGSKKDVNKPYRIDDSVKQNTVFLQEKFLLKNQGPGIEIRRTRL
jgi:hypothetical protein